MADYIGDDETDLLPPLTDEEQAQLAGLRPPGLQAGAGPMPSAPVSTAPQPLPITGPANARLQEVLGERPVLTQPKWWQRLAGAAAGGAAGWSNASGRTRNPIDIDQLTQNILAPGYNSKLAEWQSRVAPLEQQAQLETAKNQAWWKNAGAQAGIDQKAAEAEMQRQHGQYFENRSKQEQNQWKIGAGGKLYNTITGESKDAPETPEDRFGTAKALGVDDEGAKFYALNKKLPEAKEHNVSEAELRFRAAQGDPVAVRAVKDEADTRIRVSRESRPAAAATGGESTPPPSSDLPRLKAIANGDIPAPSPRSKGYNQTMDWVYQLDPTYTEGRYLGKKGFQNSKDSQNIGTITRIMGHLERFDKNSKELGTSPLLSMNVTGPQRRLHVVSNAIAEEFGKLVSGGVLTQEQARKAESNLLSPIESVRRDAIDEVNHLMDSQFEGIYQRYRGATNQEFPTGKYFDKATQERLVKRGAFPQSGGQSGTGPGEAAVPGSVDAGADAILNAQIPGQKASTIHASQKDAFLKKYPNARVW